MSLLPFLAVASLGTVIVTVLRDRRWLGTLAAIAAILVALGAAVVVRPDAPLGIGGGALAGSDHVRVVLVLCLASGLLVLIVARLATWQPSAPGALLGGAAGIGLALGLAGTPPALLGAAAAFARPRALRPVLLVCTIAFSVALGQGLVAGTSAVQLEALGPREWTGTVSADPRTGPFGTTVAVHVDSTPLGVTTSVAWPKETAPPDYGARVRIDTRLRALLRQEASADAFRRGETLRASP